MDGGKLYIWMQLGIRLIPISTGLQAFFSDLEIFLLHFLPEKILFFFTPIITLLFSIEKGEGVGREAGGESLSS